MTATPEQLEEIFQYCINFAEEMLNKSGEFHPFGAKLDQTKNVIAVGGWTGEEHPNSQELFSFLLNTLRGELNDGTALGAAIAVNVNIPDQYHSSFPDGIRVSLETKDSSRLIYIPYKIIRTGLFKSKRTTEFAEPFAVET